MKKISILSLHLGYGGIEKSVVSLANELCKKYDVEIAVCYNLYDKCVFDLDKRVKVNYLNSKEIIPNHKELREALHSFNIFKIIKQSFFASKVLRARKRSVTNYIKNCSSDVIISTRDIFNSWTGKYAKEGIIKIAWEHNHFHGNMKYAKKIVDSVSNIDTLVLVTNELNDFYNKELKNKKCRTICIPNCIESIPKDVSKLNDKRFISVGRLSPEKGYMDLLKVFQMFDSKHPGWVLDIIGDGSEVDSLKEYISTNHLEDKITLHGFQGKDYIEKIMMKSSIYLMTSHTESFGIVLIEAMSYGIPCIAMDSAEGARDIIINDKNGYLIKDRNFESMIQMMEKLADNNELRNKMGKNARESISKYTSDVIGEKWIDLIEKSGANER